MAAKKLDIHHLTQQVDDMYSTQVAAPRDRNPILENRHCLFPKAAGSSGDSNLLLSQAADMMTRLKSKTSTQNQQWKEVMLLTPVIVSTHIMQQPLDTKMTQVRYIAGTILHA